MKKKNIKKLMISAGYIFLVLAFTPTFLKALSNQMHGQYGEAGRSYWNQPLYPFMTLITIAIALVILPVALWQEFFKKK